MERKGAFDAQCAPLQGCSPGIYRRVGSPFAFAVGLTDDLMDWKIVSLDFGSSSSYYAYICNEDTAIGAHYRLVGELTHEIRIFDDVPSPYWPEVQSQLYKLYFAFKSFNALRASIALPS